VRGVILVSLENASFHMVHAFVGLSDCRIIATAPIFNSQSTASPAHKEIKRKNKSSPESKENLFESGHFSCRIL
jgi:hypothetical protein